MSQVTYQTASIALPGRWSGQVAILQSAYEHSPSGAADAPPPQSHPSSVEPLQRLAEQLIHDPSKLNGYTVVKYSKRGEVIKATVDLHGSSMAIIAKRSRVVGVRTRIRCMLRKSRERRNFDRAMTLISTGINTAQPLMLLERRGAIREAWLVSEFVHGLVDLDQLALVELPRLDSRHAYRTKLAAITAVIDLLGRLQGAGLGHRDFKASNVLLADGDPGSDGRSASDGASAWLLDLDGLHRYRSSSVSQQWQPITRLAASLIGHSTITSADYCRFLNLYLDGQRNSRRGWKDHYRRLARLAEDYTRRAKHRKAGKLDGYAGD